MNLAPYLPYQFKEIMTPELKIILALSDLLDEPNEFEPHFINDSLSYLKENYGLTKGVWKVLLRLNNIIPDFTDKLSTWKLRNYYTDARPYDIKYFFLTIHLLYQHFTIEETIDYIGLFVETFDTKKHSFSRTNLAIHAKYLKSIKSEDSISDHDITFLVSRMFKHRDISQLLSDAKRTYSIYSKPPTDKNKIYLPNCLNTISPLLGEEPTDYLAAFEELIKVYTKYTNEDFLTLKGLLEIKNKTIEEMDYVIVNRLLLALEKSQQYNLVHQQITICLIKLLDSYSNNVIRGIEKIHDIEDFVCGLNNMDNLVELLLKNNLNLKALLTLCNNWEKQSVTIGENIFYQNYNIEAKVGNYNFEQIKNSHELYREGKAQGHCVYTHYQSNCTTGNTIIVSMKDRQGNRVSTIRLLKQEQSVPKILKLFKTKKTHSWYLVENKKRFNKSCSTEEKAAANAYFKEIKDRLP